MDRVKARIMDKESIDRALVRIAHEILERNHGTEGIALVGIRTGGVHLAARLIKNIKNIEGVDVPMGALDVTMYRDDLSSRKKHLPLGRTDIPFDIKDLTIVLVDDVLYTGRTIRAAMDGLMDIGRPRQIQLAVLLDRGHKELPITADYVGKNVPTSRKEAVKVMLSAEGGPDEVVILDREEA
ncbi:MAG: bifunctional pyr operon transcriptional regulator/uracil phosphoribosyltransferase PyrR [Nitrospirota bacterium]